MTPAAPVINEPAAPFNRAPGVPLIVLLWAALSVISSAAPLTTGSPLSFKLSAEARFRYEVRDELGGRVETERLLIRGVLGGEVRAAAGTRAYGEIAAGEVSADRRDAQPNLRNELSLQQMWLEVPGSVAAWETRVRLGRQEFDDGPRQLVSVSDGPNLHRTWNGARLVVKRDGVKLGAFAFRATQLGRHGFDERVSRTERLGGVTASFAIPGARGTWRVEPYWLHTRKPGSSRDTFGARAWGRRGGFSLDWSAALQSGHTGNRGIAAWAMFASQSLELTARGWKPRVGLRIDAASGEGADRNRPSGRFDQLYASSGYLGEGLFLSASNLVMVSPGFSLTPTERLKLAVDYGFARRFDERDAAYAGQMRAYPGSSAVAGCEIGSLLRVMFQWSATPRMVVGLDYEHLSRGDVLVRAHLPSRRYAHGSVTFRY